MAKRLRIKRIRGASPDDRMDHYASLPGQSAPTLCGWDAGREDRDYIGEAPFCHECRTIYIWARGAEAHARDSQRSEDAP